MPLLEVYDKLRETLRKMTSVNEMNKGLVNESLDFIKYNLNLLKSAYQDPETGNNTKNALNT